MHKITLSKEELRRMYEEGKSQTEIAKLCNVSRERIRQVLVNQLKLKTGRQQLKEKRDAKLVEQLKKQQVREATRLIKKAESEAALKDKYQNLQDLWEAGKTIKQIHEVSGIPKGSLSWIMGKLRAEFGWFAKRRPSYTRK